MRTRQIAHTVPVVGTWQRWDFIASAYNETGSINETVVDSESLMWDDPTGGRRVTKPCTHLSYSVESLRGTRNAYHQGDGSNVPNPRYRYDGFSTFAAARLGLYRPPTVLNNKGSYIPVTAASTDDLGKCIFDAYNQFVNGVRALDASTSIAELGETPGLFTLWQRRRALPSNIVNGFLNYSFGWRPVLSDLRAISRELRSFPSTVRKRLKSIGDGDVVRHYRFNLSSTVDSLNHVTSQGQPLPYGWSKYLEDEKTVSKSRMVCVTIRAKVKPKLTGEGQDLLNKLGALGLIPSLATVWSVTRLSFVVDWFYNIGGAIENLQGSLTHDISNVSVCITDTRSRVIEVRCDDDSGYNSCLIGKVQQRYFDRQPSAVPILPPLIIPSSPMKYVLLGLLSLNKTKSGARLLRLADGSMLSKRVTAKINNAIDVMSKARQKAHGKDIFSGW